MALGTHAGMVGLTPENISDGFYYVPLLQSLQALLNNASIRSQVCIMLNNYVIALTGVGYACITGFIRF